MVSSPENPITGVCVVSDKNRAPQHFQAITKCQDDQTVEADVWKDGFFALSRIYRYVCVCKTVPENAFTCSVLADLTISADKDSVPPDFLPIELTEDTREKALRKKVLAVRMVPRSSAVDAISDIVLLTRQKRPPTGYTLAGEIDSVCVCFKYGVIPPDFGSNNPSQQASSLSYTNLFPYPLHPQSQQQAVGGVSGANNGLAAVNVNQLQRQSSQSCHQSGVDGVPFELHASLRVSDNDLAGGLPRMKDWTQMQLESEFGYNFRVEQQVLESSLTM